MMVFDNSGPIYVQIKKHLEYRIIKGFYPLGSKLPSVRELGIEYGVTVVIMQRALTQLQESELIIVKRGIGNFVTEEELVVESTKALIIQEKRNELIEFLEDIDVTIDEFMKGV